ncbi:hypothetical protein BPOR_0314g00090 [Botrytis porri]|uniref:Uncharacterized protein n=1 Tax=Botrytis porri TaxID=87229 RepID=A0A4Z1KQP7_9HELO|nr:hypothetical protein BPOR_0314g00090 [Botrytis porri]
MTSGPDEEFPGENEYIAGQIKQSIEQADTRSEQIEASEVAPQHSISNSDIPAKTTISREGSRPKQSVATRGRTKAKGDTKSIDWGIVTIQRRKEYRRKLKRSLSSKKQAAEASARVLSNHNSKASVLGERPHLLQQGLKKAQLASFTTQLESELSVAGVSATTAHKDSSLLGESPHSSRLGQDLQLNPSSNRLQTLDEMIEEEKEIASQLRYMRASCPSPEENRKGYQNDDRSEAVESGSKEAPNESRFCVVL